MSRNYNKFHIYKVGDVISNVKSGELKILECTRVGKRRNKGYKYKCLKCGNVDFINEYDLKSQSGCNACCHNPKIKSGINDISTTADWMIDILWNREDGYKYSPNSGKLLDWKCKNCGNRVGKKSPNSVYYFGLSCPRCSDGVSYPNKAVFNVLQQTTRCFEIEKTFNWSEYIESENTRLNGAKRYDFYIPDPKAIIEVHGGQHYNTPFNKRGGSLKDEQENDRLKKRLAVNSGDIEYYIVVRADDSNIEQLKKNLFQSELSQLIDLNVVNWEIVDNYATSSLVFEACEYHENGIWNPVEIGKIMKRDSSTIREYLARGVQLGICTYDPKNSIRNIATIMQNSRKIPVVQLGIDWEFVAFHKSATEASNRLKTQQSHITSTCRGKRKTAGGYRWMYKEDYDRMVVEKGESNHV